MQAVVDDLLTQYELKGKGKLVLLVHGWTDDSQAWYAFQDRLAEHYQVLALDLPGFGRSQVPAAAWNLDNYAGFLRDVLAKLELPQPFAVIGHSNGGSISIRAVALGMLQPKKLVLLAAAGIRRRHGLRRFIFAGIAKVGKVVTFWLPLRYKQALRRRLYGAAGSDLLVLQHMQATFKKTVRQDVQADAARLTLPTLLLYGEADEAVPAADGERYHRLIKGSQLRIVPGGDHFMHATQADVVLPAIQEFLDAR